MVCPYFSKLNQKEIFCQSYGRIEVTPEKMQECVSNYSGCFEEAQKRLDLESQNKNKSFQNSPDLTNCFENEFIF